jgi:hypothetical protein
VQMQRKVIINIRDLLTMQSLQVINLRNLKAYIERAIKQSGNKNIISVKIVSSS